MDCCKYCSSDDIIKNGRPNGVQRYRCNSCKKSQIEGDKRVKYPNRIRYLAVSMYLNNSGFRSIGRVLDVPFQLVHYWIKKAGEIVEEEVKKIKDEPRDIAILEMDELYSFVQKNAGNCEFGWLSIGTETRLLRIT